MANLIAFKEFFEASKFDLTYSIHNLKKIKMDPLPEVKFVKT